jgi:hypothetical protein
VPACGHSGASSARTINPPSLLSGPHFGRRCRSLSSRRCNSADPPPVPARSAHAALPWMAELAARRYSPSPERWIEHPQNPSAFDPRQRDDLTGRQIGLRPAGAQQRRLPLRYKRLAKIINLAENLDDPIQHHRLRHSAMVAYLKKPFSHNPLIAQKLPIRVAYKL